MDRRAFLALAAATTAVTIAPLSALAAPLTYSPGLVDKHLAKGHTVFLDFKASWCSTCRAQERVIQSLIKDNPAYEDHIIFINVDWDDYGKSDLVRRLNIPRRSTLVALKGKTELGRIVAGTRKSDIRALMDTALVAAGGA